MVKPQHQEAVPCSNVSFSATVEGSAPLRLKWFKENRQLLPGKNCEIHLKENIAVLKLHNIDKSHAGAYLCQISNDVGEETCQVNLMVKGQFTLPLRTVIIAV